LDSYHFEVRDSEVASDAINQLFTDPEVKGVKFDLARGHGEHPGIHEITTQNSEAAHEIRRRLKALRIPYTEEMFNGRYRDSSEVS
jgi:hypothetical protein